MPAPKLPPEAEATLLRSSGSLPGGRTLAACDVRCLRLPPGGAGACRDAARSSRAVAALGCWPRARETRKWRTRLITMGPSWRVRLHRLVGPQRAAASLRHRLTHLRWHVLPPNGGGVGDAAIPTGPRLVGRNVTRSNNEAFAIVYGTLRGNIPLAVRRRLRAPRARDGPQLQRQGGPPSCRRLTIVVWPRRAHSARICRIGTSCATSVTLPFPIEASFSGRAVPRIGRASTVIATRRR